MKLDYSALDQALKQLERGLERAKAEPKDELLRDGVIQRFEYSYELSHKTLRRYLELTEASPEELDGFNFQQLIRLGSERGLVRAGWDEWKNFRTARGITSHTYDEDKAREVFEQIPGFLDEATHLLKQLKAHAVDE